MGESGGVNGGGSHNARPDGDGLRIDQSNQLDRHRHELREAREHDGDQA